MSNIIAHIVFDDNNVLKSIEIVGDQTDYKTDLKTIVESGGEKDFYIKISVKQCANVSMDCFSLSNGNMYQLDFDDFDFSNHVPIDKLLTTSADSKSVESMQKGSLADSTQKGSLADSNSVKLISSPNTEGADLNIHRFKEVIVDELNKILKKEVPS